MLDRAYLARLLAAPLDADVHAWVLSRSCVGAMTPSERREDRDGWIRAAAALVPASCVGARAAASPARRSSSRSCDPAEVPDTPTARGCVAAALLVSP